MALRTAYARWVEDWWLFELLAICCSCILTVALCVILRSYDGREDPSFGTIFQWGITLNTVVAILATVSVATATFAIAECISQLKWYWLIGRDRALQDIETFDAASRGSMGSLQLFWKLKMDPVAYAGAFLMIAQLAIVPLAQQSLQTDYHNVPIDGVNATISVATVWDEESQQMISPNMPAGYTALSLGMKGQILQGLYTEPQFTLNDTLPACLSGNCTFDDYPSLAVCSWVANVSDHLLDLSTTTAKGARTGKYCIAGDKCLTFKDRIIRANMTSAAPLNDLREPLTDPPGQPGALKSLSFNSTAFKNHTNPILDAYMIFLNTSNYSPNGSNYEAVEFMLDWCVPQFSTIVVNGTATSFRRSVPITSLQSINTDRAGRLGNRSFSVDSFTHYTLQRYFGGLMSGVISEAGGEYASDSEIVQVIGRAVGASNRTVFGLEAGVPLFGVVLSNVATSMTNHMRKTSHQVNGTVFTERSFVAVQWGWLAAPIAFSVVSLAFCIAATALPRSRGFNPPKWKSSSIAALRSLDSQLHGALGPMGLRSAMEEQAERIHVRLIGNDRQDSWSISHIEKVVNEGDYTALHSKDHELTQVSARITPREADGIDQEGPWERRASATEHHGAL